MAILLDEYREWNTPVVGAYLLWRFSAGYVNANPRHAPPPFLLHCVVTALLRGRAYSDAIDHSLSLHAFATRLVKDGWLGVSAMGLVKTRRLAAMQKQQRAKAGMKPPKPKYNLKSDYRRRKP